MNRTGMAPTMGSSTSCRRAATASRKPNYRQASIVGTGRLGDLGFNQLLAIRLERSPSARLDELHEATITDHVGSWNGSETAIHW